MKAKTIQGISLEEVRSKLTDACADGFLPSMAIVFCSVQQNIPKVSGLFDSLNIAVFGSSSSGEIEQDDIYDSSIVAMLMDMDTEYFDIRIEKTNDKPIKEVTEQVIAQAYNKFSNPGILVAASGLDTDGEEIVESMKNSASGSIPIFGGLAGDDLQMEKTFVFSNNKVCDKGLVSLILDTDKIQINGTATSGWETIGVETTITKSLGNVVFTIDNQPALDFFVKYYNLDVDTNNKSDVVQKIGVKYPLQLIRENGTRVLRAPLYANQDNKSLVFAGRVPQNTKATFSVPPTFDVIEKTIKNVQKLKATSPVADAMIMFSCAARKNVLGPLMEDEVSGIREIWNVPQIGLFSYGEIGSAQDQIPDFHNETCCMVLLKEK